VYNYSRLFPGGLFYFQHAIPSCIVWRVRESLLYISYSAELHHPRNKASQPLNYPYQTSTSKSTEYHHVRGSKMQDAQEIVTAPTPCRLKSPPQELRFDTTPQSTSREATLLSLREITSLPPYRTLRPHLPAVGNRSADRVSQIRRFAGTLATRIVQGWACLCCCFALVEGYTLYEGRLDDISKSFEWTEANVLSELRWRSRS